LRTVLVTGSYARLNKSGRSKNYSPSYTTYQKLLYYYLKPIEVFKIVIFPVCATVDPSDTISMEDATRVISEIQMTAMRSWIDLISNRRFNMGPVFPANKYVLSKKNHADRTAAYQASLLDYKAKVAEYKAKIAEYEENKARLGAGGGPVHGSGGGNYEMEGGRRQKYTSIRSLRKTKKKRKPSKHTRRH